MDITLYIWGAAFIVAAMFFGLSVRQARKYLAETHPTQPNDIKMIYLAADGAQHQIKVDIKKVFWSKDSFDSKHLMLDAIDTQGLQHTLAAERVLAAYTPNGEMLPNFHQYLLQLRKKELLLGWLPNVH